MAAPGGKVGAICLKAANCAWLMSAPMLGPEGTPAESVQLRPAVVTLQLELLWVEP